MALIGENGAGKSTLMKILGGVIQRDAGDIRLDGEQIEIHSPSDASRRRIEFIHQELSVLDNLDVAANIFLASRTDDRRLAKVNRPQAALSRSRCVAGETRARHFESHAARPNCRWRNSSWSKSPEPSQRGARILIMDEPTSSLTLTETRRLLEIVRDLKAHDVSIIYISHRLHEVEEIADRVVVLARWKKRGRDCAAAKSITIAWCE